ncbi:akuammiline synthase 2-like [Castanea sativa]|uniref:akuammiline synthase 2-like n=1 Tax=Castanea sativa TaxID=21020 RepID=UPI003F64BB98
MNMVKVAIQARVTIKPSSPTPQNLKIFKLSLLDQIAPPEYVPRIFYYACNDITKFIKPQERINQLKESLSQALTHIYPLSGRVRENLFIECNDEGVDFLEAKANCTLLEILNLPEVSVLDQFLPHDCHCNKSSMEAQLAIQVNTFSCGGMAIGTCALHKIVDGGTFSSFLNMWAEITTGAGDNLSPIFPGPNLFSPRDLSGLVPRFDGVPKAKCVTKRFVFPGSKIASLKEIITASNTKVPHPTRIEVVSTLIWKCAMVVSKARAGSLSPSIMTHAVDLRPRNDPPLPKCAAGNLSWLMQGENGFSVMSDSLKQIGETKNFEVFRSISWANYRLYEADFCWGKPIWWLIDVMMFGGYSGPKYSANSNLSHVFFSPTRIEVVSALIWKCAMEVSKARSGSLSPSIMTHAVDSRPRNDPPLPKCAAVNLSWKMQGENGFSVMSDSLKQIGELVPKNVEVFRFISWANYRLYEADFGWGKPIWVSTAPLAFKNIIIFIETRVNSGLEAWVTMEEQDMDIFEQNQELCSFVDSIEYV